MSTPTPSAAPARRWPAGLLLALLLALALRLLLWNRIPRLGLISDEGEYLSAADWLAHGRGFSWYLGYFWTRAPLYPLFVAAHLRLFGDTPAPIYLSQLALSLLNVALVYALASQVAGRSRAVPTMAALLMALYFPFALYTQVLLSETLFVALLLAAFVALAAWARARRGRRAWLLAAGGLFGLATLTRGLTLGFLPVVALWLLHSAWAAHAKQHTSRLRALLTPRLWLDPAAFVLAAMLVILPWTVYNSRLYGGLVVVDTTGAFNVLLGGRTAFDGDRNDAATRDFALALIDPALPRAERERKLADVRAPDGTLVRAGSCLYARSDPALLAALGTPAGQIRQAARQQLMTREGLCLIRARPLAFARKSLAELADLFQINPTGAERFMNKFSSGRLPPWYPLALFALDDTIYVLALPLAVVGWALVRKAEGRRQKAETTKQPGSFILHPSSFILLVGLWWLYNLAVAPLLFAINRFRLPLLPFGFIFAAYALAALPRGWGGLRSRYGGLCAALAALLLLVAATPYAYLEPRAPGADSRWASYLGPYPSSLDITLRTLGYRAGFVRAEQLRAALAAGRADDAAALLAAGPINSVRADGIAADTAALAAALLDGLRGQPAAGAARLPAPEAIAAAKDVEAAVALGDLLRSSGDLPAARRILGQTFVDDNNPVEWAWAWLRPARVPNNQLDIAGNLDLGYLSGCYLGEGDPQAGGNFRWCTDGARLRFPQAGTGAPQTLTLRADGRGWAGYAAAPPIVQVFVNNEVAGTFTPLPDAPAEFAVRLPPTPTGADVVVTLRTPTFIPDAGRYIRQQGKAVVGQVQRLGVRLDWARLGAAP